MKKGFLIKSKKKRQSNAATPPTIKENNSNDNDSSPPFPSSAISPSSTTTTTTAAASNPSLEKGSSSIDSSWAKRGFLTSAAAYTTRSKNEGGCRKLDQADNNNNNRNPTVTTMNWNKGFLNPNKKKKKKSPRINEKKRNEMIVQSTKTAINSATSSTASSLLLSLETTLTKDQSETIVDGSDSNSVFQSSLLLDQDLERKDVNAAKNKTSISTVSKQSSKPMIVEVISHSDNQDSTSTNTNENDDQSDSLFMQTPSSLTTSIIAPSTSSRKVNQNESTVLLPLKDSNHHNNTSTSTTINSDNGKEQNAFLLNELSTKRYSNPTPSTSSNISTKTTSLTTSNNQKIIDNDSDFGPSKSSSPQSITKGLPTDLSLILSKMKKMKHKYIKRNKMIDHHLQVEDNHPSPTYMTNFLQRYFDETNNNCSSTSTKANFRFVWDSLKEKLANPSKDISSVITKMKKYNSIQSYHERSLFLVLPTHVHLSLILLDYCPYFGWITLLDQMTILTNDIVTSMKRKECNNRSDASCNSRDNAVSSFCVPTTKPSHEMQEEELKEKKIQLLGVYAIIKIHASFSLHLLQQKIFQRQNNDHATTATSTTTTNSNETVDDRNGSCDGMSSLIKSKQIMQAMKATIAEGIPLILEIMESNEKKRTVLSSLGMDCIMYLLEYTSLLFKVEFSSNDMDGLDGVMWKIMPTLKQVLMIKLHWNLSPSDHSKMIKKQCSDAVIRDFIKAIDKAELHHNKCIVSSCSVSVGVQVAARKLIDELVGVIIGDKESSNCPELCLGGIAQSIASDVHSKKETELETLLHMLHVAIQFMSDTSSTSPSALVGDAQEEVYCLRSVCSWMSERRNIAQVLHNNPSSVEQAVNLSFNLLKSKSERALELVHLLLNTLWSNSNGIPADVMHLDEANPIHGDIPESFLTMVRELNMSQAVENEVIDPSERIISDMVRRCIVHCQAILLPAFLKTAKQSNHKAHVLLSLLEHSSHISQSTCEEIELKLFDLLPSSRLLQKALYTHPGTISQLHPQSMIHLCCKFLVDTKSNTEYVVSTASKLLSHSIQKNASQSSSAMVKALIEIIGVEDDEKEEVSKNILKYSELWRKALIEESTKKENYSLFLQAVCIEMFDQPSNSSIFSLFAVLIGEGNEKDLTTDQQRERIAIATKALISQCLNEYNKCQSLDEKMKENVFVVIAPSLLLRRIPYTYYKILHNDHANGSLLRKLSDILASKIGIFEETNDAKNIFEFAKTTCSSQERKLVAELVPRCLPFSASAKGFGINLHGFQRFCHSIFTSTLTKIDRNSMELSDWRMAKISLYICCHAIHLNLNSFDVKDFKFMLVFVTKIFQQEVFSDNSAVELQTGCIDFLATCIESICMVSNYGNAEITLRVIDDTSKKKQNTTRVEILQQIFIQVMFQIIENNKKPSTTSHIYFDESFTFSVATRTCVLNAFTTASKRCPQENLTALSKIFIPRILAWALGGPIDSITRHPLCLAAMMQCIFILLTRSKSAIFLETNGKAVESNLYDLFQLSMEAIKFKGRKSFDIYSISSMRVAALKLLMGIISVDQTLSSSSSKFFGSLAPGDISRAISIIRGAANVDQDPVVRKLAEHLISVLQ